MGIFRDLYKYKQELTKMLFSNQSLLKYLYYNSADSLTKDRIKNPYSMINKQIFFKPKDFKTVDSVQSFLLINFESSPIHNSLAYKDTYVVCDILVHNTILDVIGETGENENRLYNIMDEIDSYLNGKNSPDLGIGKTTFESFKLTLFNNDYVSARLIYKLTDRNLNFRNGS